MSNWFWTGLKELAVALAVSPIVIGIGWAVVEGSILSRFIPREDMEERAAWRRSEDYGQGKWRRVRKAIRRRLLAGELPSA